MFAKLIEIEQTVAAVYRALADSVPCDPDLRQLWREMAWDEDTHAAQLRLAQRLSREAVFSDPQLGRETVERLHTSSRSLLAQVHSHPPTVAEALDLCRRLEQDFLDVHLHRAFAVTDPEARRILDSVCRADAEHVAALERLLQAHTGGG